MVSVRRDQQWVLCCWCADCNSSGEGGKSPCTCVFMDLKKIVRLCRPESYYCRGKRSHASVYQPRCLQLSTSFTAALGLACVRMTVSTQNGFKPRRGPRPWLWQGGHSSALVSQWLGITPAIDPPVTLRSQAFELL